MKRPLCRALCAAFACAALVCIVLLAGCSAKRGADSGARQANNRTSDAVELGGTPLRGTLALQVGDSMFLLDPFSALTYRLSAGGVLERVDDTSGRENLQAEGEWLYYLLPDDAGKRDLYRMLHNGEKKEKLPLDTFSLGESYAVCADGLYFARQVGDERGLFRADPDGKNAELVYAGEAIRDLYIYEGKVHFKRTLLSNTTQAFWLVPGSEGALPAARSIRYEMNGWFYVSYDSGKVVRELFDGSLSEALPIHGTLLGVRSGYIYLYTGEAIVSVLPDGTSMQTIWSEPKVKLMTECGTDLVGNHLYFCATRYWPTDQPTPEISYKNTPAPTMPPAGRLHRLNLLTGELEIFNFPRLETESIPLA